MSPLISEEISIEGKGLRYKLTVITALMSVLPFLVFSVILYKEELFFEFENFYAVSLVFLLLLSLAGMIILRQVFDKFILVNLYMQKAEAGEMVRMEVQKDTAELHDITVAFNSIVQRLEDTSNRLEEQTLKVKQQITERILMAGKLWESETMYRDLVDQIKEAIFMVDKDGLLTYVSPAFERISGYSTSRITGRFLKELVHPEDLPSLMDSSQRVFSGGAESIEFRLLSSSGIRWIHSFQKPIFTGEEIVGIQGLMTDITDIKDTKEELHQKTQEVERLSKLANAEELKMDELRREMARLQTKIKELEHKKV